MAALLDDWTSPDPARHLGLVRAVARGVRRPRWHDRDDLLQDGAAGLCAAAGRWEPGRGVPWPVYATVCVRRGMRDGMRRLAPAAASLDAPAWTDGPALLEVLPDAAAVDPAEAACASDVRRRLGAAVDALPPRTRDAVRLCWGVGLSQRQAAARMGVSPSRVRQALARARLLLRPAVSGGGGASP